MNSFKEYKVFELVYDDEVLYIGVAKNPYSNKQILRNTKGHKAYQKDLELYIIYKTYSKKKALSYMDRYIKENNIVI